MMEAPMEQRVFLLHGQPITYLGKVIVANTAAEVRNGPSTVTAPLADFSARALGLDRLITVSQWRKTRSTEPNQYGVEPSSFRRFELHRDEDETGTSGTGIVVEGCQFSAGMVALTWLTGPDTSWCWYPSIEAVERVHGHGGRTRVVWLDGHR